MNHQDENHMILPYADDGPQYDDLHDTLADIGRGLDSTPWMDAEDLERQRELDDALFNEREFLHEVEHKNFDGVEHE